MSNKILSASAKGATFLILLQIGSRALTFAVNQILLRFLSPELLGVSAQLELFSISVLYFARESLRVALQRQAHGVQTVVNLSYLAIFSGVPLIYGLGVLWLRSDTPHVPYFVDALTLYCFATFIELLTEPAFSAVQQKLLYKVRASAESAATLMRCLGTCGSAIWASRSGVDLGVLPFAIGQLSYAFALLVVYMYKLWPISKNEKFSLLAKQIQSTPSNPYFLSYFSAPLSKLTLSLTLQSTLKYILTQGDSLLITGLTSLSDQGAYALASNYGGLIARMLFQPIEESSRNLFAKLCADSEVQKDTKQPKRGGNEKADEKKKELDQASRILLTILHLYTLLSLLAITLGPPLSHPLLTLVAGRKWSSTSASSVLATYCYYIPFLALNGVTEAFVAAVASPSDLHKQSVSMFIFFGLFAASAWGFIAHLGLGGSGVVAANCVNMGLRIVWNTRFIANFFKRRGLEFSIWDALPTTLTIGAAILTSAVLKANSLEGLVSQFGIFGDLARLVAIGGIFGLSMLYFERQFLLDCYRMLRPASAPAPASTAETEKKELAVTCTTSAHFCPASPTYVIHSRACCSAPLHLATQSGLSYIKKKRVREFQRVTNLKLFSIRLINMTNSCIKFQTSYSSMPYKDSSHYHGLVDMGSNGIRFSITDLSPPTQRLLPVIFHDRAAISLYDAQFDASGNRIPIPKSTIHQVVQALLRFKSTCKDFHVPDHQIRILATEATRTALNSETFRSAIQVSVGWHVDLLSKEEEGRLGAYGIASSYAEVKGLVMDLGGGSTQISWINTKEGEIKMAEAESSVSLPYGAAALTKKLEAAGERTGKAWEAFEEEVSRNLESAIRKNLDGLFASSPHLWPQVLSENQYKSVVNLYLSGGGFRGWGFVLLSEHVVKPYPIPIVNGFRVTAEEFQETDRVAAAVRGTGNDDGTPDIFRISGRRASQVPAVTFLVQCLLRALSAITEVSIRNVHFCQGGVREGTHFSNLDASLRAEHPLVTATRPSAPESVSELVGILESVTYYKQREGPLQRAFGRSILTAFVQAMYVHANFPKDISAGAALRSTTTGYFANAHGVSHEERALLALLLCESHGGFGSISPTEQNFYTRIAKLVPDWKCWFCMLVGRIAAMLRRVFPAGVVRKGQKKIEMEAKWGWKKRQDMGIDIFYINLRFEQMDEALQKAVKAVEKVGKRKNWTSEWGREVSVTFGVRNIDQNEYEKIND
ncbi:Rft-1-domain-containing protein [Delitschia confertaspora ATCC 74209]|uniref:Man(5)GlcNAc(2)-PP-dolichol translocation protein RFT1 n=1 Tax=Delitschia confertaspora ATCC 74209 TaxID=1513339 RepID=A0A9P4JEW1_9PLEO|nr:Rft-1-domain-containing protein [Delitschia confertaspora ATCC 74209]